MVPPLKHIWLLLTAGFSHDWQVVQGICQSALTHHWLIIPHKPNEMTPDLLKQANVDGIIGMIMTTDLADAIVKRNIPTVNFNHAQAKKLPSILVDDYRCGEMAAEYFLGKGFIHYAYAGYIEGGERYTVERRRGFIDRLAKEDQADKVIDLPSHMTTNAWNALRLRDAPPSFEWVENLPKPLAVLAEHDWIGLEFCAACQRSGIRVPEEVAILGIHNAQVTCEMCTPPLSSIDTATQRTGYLAVDMLAQQLAGDERGRRTVVLPPVGVVTRSSTDVVAVTDPVVVEALHYIRDHVGDGIGVAEVVRALSISRTQLAYRFKEALGRSPLSEIHRLRVARVLMLLATTTLDMSTIARRAGYQRQDRMAQAVRQATGLSPTAYRTKFHDPD